MTLKNLAGNREDAYGRVDMSQTPYTGIIYHPDFRKEYTFWFYPDKGSFYFDGDKGETTNTWKNARCTPDKIGISYCDNFKKKEIVLPLFFYIRKKIICNITLEWSRGK